MMSKNPYIFSEIYPDIDIIDYNPEEAYELGVDAGLNNPIEGHKHVYSYNNPSMSGAPTCECGKIMP